MSANWYYVEDNQRVGPVDEEEFKGFIQSGKIKSDTYIWKKGFDNWKKLQEVDEFKSMTSQPAPAASPKVEKDISSIPVMNESSAPKKVVDWNRIKDDDQIVMIKVGYDRGGDEVEYGPFSITQLSRAYEEARINGKTFAFVPGMDNWMFLAELPIFPRITTEVPPTIEEKDRRIHTRKPFVTRLFFHDNSEFYEGIARDISVGGMQILVSQFPARVGEQIKMNVHPDNSEYCFVATGKIVRVLEGNQGFSIRFDQIDNEANQAIRNYLEQN
ncbi:MAG: hypothetical protein COW00_09000 [Bdellovibrio sp. CG12_big_fil_rev_8_21_14_0_65_39_13]|nr:MAG: hypothetical protein COW78_09070 [Bdellovibrio sp. CG22_combo_CG10-13_8_21_14_all_39_27]PIQ59762.1 MAG: hypothetical protein COW00_09000 [Bdellovibrio sp. CG12_big_fil_rev_8_21_14_0_65_39_13]PIR36208.1 MAG: hypothetical protein COV37_04385 [Bdellovibrio sp. CG11_big_fil_rev_8_21_14_0_20_39_38]